MAGDMEVGTCPQCGRKNVQLNREYYRYPGIHCECCSGDHFEIVYYCNQCEPKEPREVHIVYKSDYARRVGKMVNLFMDKEKVLES